MSALPISLTYNLNRLGQAGDEIGFSANEAERAALASHVDALGISQFDARILLRKDSPNNFTVNFELRAEITQACVVTLEPLVARLERDFQRELHYIPNLRRQEKDGTEKDLIIALDGEEAPEEIDSLHYDLAGPLVEEFVLAVDPYPRAPGVEFTPPEDEAKPENPFAALKTLKPGQKETK